MQTYRRLWDTYRFPGFRPTPTVQGIFGDPKARVITCADGEKTACGACGQVSRSWYDRKTRRVRDLPCGNTRIYLEVEMRRVDCTRCPMQPGTDSRRRPQDGGVERVHRAARSTDLVDPRGGCLQPAAIKAAPP